MPKFDPAKSYGEKYNKINFNQRNLDVDSALGAQFNGSLSEGITPESDLIGNQLAKIPKIQSATTTQPATTKPKASDGSSGTVGSVLGGLGMSAINGVLKYVESFGKWEFGVVASNAQNAINTADQISIGLTGNAISKEGQARYDKFKSDLHSANEAGDIEKMKALAQKYLVDDPQRMELEARVNANQQQLNSTEDLLNPMALISSWRNLSERPWKTAINWATKTADIENESETVQMLASGVESLPYTAASLLPVGGFILNYGAADQQNLEQKYRELVAKNPNYTGKEATMVGLYSAGSALIEATSEQVFRVGKVSAAKKLLEKPLGSSVVHLGKFLVKNGAEEGAEELISGIGQGVLAKFTTDPDATLLGVTEESGLITIEGLGKQFAVGALMGSVFSTINARKEYASWKEAKTFYNDIKNVPIGKTTEGMIVTGEQILKDGVQDEKIRAEIEQATSDTLVNVVNGMSTEKTLEIAQARLAKLYEQARTPMRVSEVEKLKAEINQQNDLVKQLQNQLKSGETAQTTLTAEQIEERLVDARRGLSTLEDIAKTTTDYAGFNDDLASQRQKVADLEAALAAATHQPEAEPASVPATPPSVSQDVTEPLAKQTTTPVQQEAPSAPRRPASTGGIKFKIINGVNVQVDADGNPVGNTVTAPIQQKIPKSKLTKAEQVLDTKGKSDTQRWLKSKGINTATIRYEMLKTLDGKHDQIRRFMREIAGVDVVFFDRVIDGQVPEGIRVPKLAGIEDQTAVGYIFINKDARLLNKVGHEFMHVADTLGVGQEFRDAINKKYGIYTLDRAIAKYMEISGHDQAFVDEYFKRTAIGGGKEFAESRFWDEYYAEMAGIVFQQKEFWDTLLEETMQDPKYKEDKDLLQKAIGLIQKIRQWFDDVIAKTFGKDYEVPAEFTAMINALQNVKDELESYRGHEENITKSEKQMSERELVQAKAGAEIEREAKAPKPEKPVVKRKPFSEFEVDNLPGDIGKAFIEKESAGLQYVNDDGTWNIQALMRLESRIKDKIMLHGQSEEAVNELGIKRELVFNLRQRAYEAKKNGAPLIATRVPTTRESIDAYNEKNTINGDVFPQAKRQYKRPDRRDLAGLIKYANYLDTLGKHPVDNNYRLAELSELTDNQIAMRAFMRDVAGRELVFITPQNKIKGQTSSAFVLHSYADYIFINTTSMTPMAKLVGHEFYHIMSATGLNSEFRQEALRALQEFNVNYDLNTIEGQQGLLRQKSGWNKDAVEQITEFGHLEEELIATYASDVWQKPAFWAAFNKRIAYKNKSFIAKMYDWACKVINHVHITDKSITSMLDAIEKSKVLGDNRDEVRRKYDPVRNDITEKLNRQMGAVHDVTRRPVPVAVRRIAATQHDSYEGSSIPHVKEQYEKNVRIEVPGNTVKERWDKAREMVDKSFMRGAIGDLPYKSTSAAITRWYGQLRQNIHQLMSMKNITRTLAMNEVKKFYEKIPKSYRKLFNDAVFVRDLREDIMLGKYYADPNTGLSNLPNGYKSIAEVYEHWNELQKHILSPEYNHGQSNLPLSECEVTKLMLARQDLLQGYRDMLSDIGRQIGYDPTQFFSHREYVAHVVKQYAEQKIAEGKQAKGSGTAKYLKRTGSGLDYVTDASLADFITIDKYMTDIMKMKTIQTLKSFDIKNNLPINEAGKEYIPDDYVMTGTWIMNLGLPQDHVQATAMAAARAFCEQNGIDGKLKDMLMAKANVNTMVLPREVVDAINKVFGGGKVSPVEKIAAKLMHGYKMMLIKAPHRALAYQMRNMIGDVDALMATYPAALQPKYLKRASQALYQLYRHGNADSNMYAYIWNGGLTTGISEVEWEDFRKISEQKFHGVEDGVSKNGVIDFLKDVNGKYEDVINFREQLLRYSAYLYMLETELNNENGLPSYYGASIPAEIQGMDSVEARAYKLSNDALGAYNDVSVAGNFVAKIIPFYRWREVNIKRYYRLLKNMIYTDRAVTAGLGNHMAERLGIVGKVGAFTAYKMGRVALSATLLTLATSLFNNFVMGKEEDKLPDYVKEQPHINLGIFNGKLHYFTGTGSLADIGDFFGIDNFIESMDDYTKGRKDLGTILAETAREPFANIITSMNPLSTALQGLITGKKTFPEGADIRDTWEYIFQAVGLGNEYRMFGVLPDRGVGNYIYNWSGIKNPVEQEQDYWSAVTLKYDYLRYIGQDDAYNIRKDPKSMALYYYKSAMRMGDEQAAYLYLQKYIIAGGTKETMKNSLATLDPWYGLQEDQIKDFKKWMTKEELATFKLAEQYYENLADDSYDFARKNWSEAEKNG